MKESFTSRIIKACYLQNETIAPPSAFKTAPLSCAFVITIFSIICLQSIAMLNGDSAEAASPSYAADDEVCVQWSDDWRWYNARVTEVSSDLIKVHYPDYGDAWDQWVEPVTVNPSYAPLVGQAVWVEWKGAYYSATVLAASSDQYLIHYDQFESEWDEWVATCRVFPLPATGDPVWVKWRMDWYYAKVLETGSDNWKVHYEGYESSWDEYVDPTRIMVCTPAQAAEAESSETTAPAAVPSGINRYSFSAVGSPVIHRDPAVARPIGVGDAANSGSRLSLSIGLPAYASPVDIYFGYAPESSNVIFLLGTDNKLHPHTDGVIPMLSGVTEPIERSIVEDLPVSALSPGRHTLILLVSPAGSLGNYQLWETEFNIQNTGVYTGEPLLGEGEVNALLKPVIEAMETEGGPAWYAAVEEFISTYTDEQGSSDAATARFLFMWAAYLENRLSPFCWAALTAVESEPDNPLALNSAIVCLLELGEMDKAGRLLDYTHYQDPNFLLTHENAAAFFDSKGDTARAVQEKLNALNSDLSWEHDAWDAYHYADSNGLTDWADTFDSRLPANYSLLKANGSRGAAPFKTKVCCSCNGTFYDNVVTCVGECDVSLACFTSICTPRLHCCWQKTPFGVEAGLCYPPTGVQVCAEYDNAGNLTVKIGGKLGTLFNSYIGITRTFKGNYNIALSAAGAHGAKMSTTLYTSDPNTRRGAAQFIGNPSTSVGGVGVGININASDWTKSPICELN